MASPSAIDSSALLPARDLLAREKVLLQQARLGQSVRLRYLIVAITGVIELVGILTGAFTTPWPVFFVLWVSALAVNFAVDMARRHGWQRDWHFTAMLVLDTVFIGGHAMAVRQLAYLSLLFFIVAAQGYSLGLPRAARLQLILGCIVYPIARLGGLWLEHSQLALASMGIIIIETVCLGGLGWLAIGAPIRYTQRLRRTRNALEVLSKGAFDTRLPTGALDDLDFLAASFNRTAEALAESATQLREQEAQLREMNKLETVGRLAGGIAHDFNNIHTVVLANLELASNEIPAGSPAHADVQEAVRATRTATELTQQLLAFGRRQILKPEILDLRAAVEEITPVIIRMVGTQIRVVTELASAPCLTRADSAQLNQALLNLATNARDAMKTIAGTLTITASTGDLEAARARGAFVVDDLSRLRREPREHVKEKGELAEEWVMLSVRDTGAGMDTETLVKVFEPFFSTKGIGMGSGLGLATVQGIVAQSGGVVAVESAPGFGTTFSIYLPAVHAIGPVLQRSARTEIPTPAGGSLLERSADRNIGVVLLAEDEPTVRISTRRILERAGYQVVEAADGVEALRRFASRESGKDGDSGPPVQILVTDLMMPNLGGAELATQLRTYRPDLPVILMSGYSEDAVLADGVTIPNAVFIGKPPQRHELVTAMARLLRREPLKEAVA